MITQTARKIPIFALTITMLAVVMGCSSQPVQNAARPPARDALVRTHGIGEKAAAIAYQQVGVPYRYGGATAQGFDCSGLVHYAYGRAGKPIARTTGALWSSTTSVSRGALQVGDLLFFDIDGKISHVGLYLGNEKFVHAPSSGRTVTVERLNSPFYEAAFIRGGRPK
ncbi:MAG: C40 family peptidase [Gammaproteobacteria bacterium]|nr:C40 family peptidase [Gammaproteobacteria bacterium]